MRRTARFVGVAVVLGVVGAVGGAGGAEGQVRGGNDQCAGAIAIKSGVVEFDNTDATTDGPAEVLCGPSGGPGRDLWYRYTAGCAGFVTASLCGSSFDTAVAVYAGRECPRVADTAIACNDDRCQLQSVVSFAAELGQEFLIRVGGSGGAGGAGGAGLLTMTCCPGLAVPPGAIAEGEECGHDFNGSCMGPATISCGEVIHGIGWAFFGTRDVDWYELTLKERTNIVCRGQAEYPLGLFVVTHPCPGRALASSVAEAGCTTPALSVTLDAGSYFVVALPQYFDGNPCESGVNEYWVSVECGVAECVCNFNHDGVIDSQDFFDFLGCFFVNCPDADINGSGTIDSQDFFDFLSCFFAPPPGCD